ncbi:MAG: patatin-like phospholipase family protein [Planctomycetaceae bacterium]|nr:patatin-like phospholipase family protein [Planctomycetaceae bacterium]
MVTTDDRKRDAFDRVAAASLKLLDLDRRPVPRDQHPKHHGCVRAKFVIAEGLEPPYRKGLFQHERVYDAWIRFSNGRQRDDRRGDVHGMAVKVMGVEGPKALPDAPDGLTQDFVMVDHPVFFLRGVEDYADFSDAVLAARGKRSSAVRNLLSWVLPVRACEAATLGLLYSFPWRLRTLARLGAFASSIIANPLETRYWSTTAYKFGDTSMKFSAVPACIAEDAALQVPASDSHRQLSEFLAQARVADLRPRPPGVDSPDYLRLAMGESLATTGAVFSFQVQLHSSSSTTPNDDPTVEWLEKDAPSRTVAWIWIPAQGFQDEGRDAFCEDLSYTPWHALAEHEPLGEINRVRRLVYERLSEKRHEANGSLPREPRPDDPDPSGRDVPIAWGNDPSAFSTVLGEELDLIRTRRKEVEDRYYRVPPSPVTAAVAGAEGPGTDREDGHPRARDVEGSGADATAEASAGPRPATGPAPEAGRPPGSAGPTLPPRPGDEDARTKAFRLQALRAHVTGLAFSGGGIRSGTFAVGFLQGLAALGLIRRFDYLSTVSGGGYAGAWLAAWLRREGGDPENVEKMLSPSRVTQSKADRMLLEKGEVVDAESEPLRHLRAYSSYLFPRPGILSADTWTVVLIWLRNVCINLMMLLPAIALVVVVARSFVRLYALFNPLTIETHRLYLLIASLAFGVLGLLAGWIAYRNNSKALRVMRDRSRPDPSLGALGSSEEVRSLVVQGIVLPMFVAFILLTLAIRPLVWTLGDLIAGMNWEKTTAVSFSVLEFITDIVQSNLDLLDWPVFLGIGLFVGLLTAWGGWSNAPRRDRAVRGLFARASFVAGASGGVLFVLVAGLVRAFARVERPDLMATFAPPLGILAVVATLIVLVALLGRKIDEGEREWWARLSAQATLGALSWAGLFATILYVPGLFLAAGPWVRAAVASGWVGSAAVGVLTGRFILPKLGGGRGLTTLLSLVSLAFLVGLAGAVALLVSFLANIPSPMAPSADDLGPFAEYIRGVNGAGILRTLAVGAFSLVLYALARELIDVNLFSLNAMYANRLTRCYLGASRAKTTWEDRWRLPRDLRADVGAPSLSHRDGPVRETNPVTGFDTGGDDLELSRLRIGSREDSRPYLGPHLLINTTLNLVGDDALLHRDRKGESFLLSPLYCGSAGVGYAKLDVPTLEGDAEPNLTLGRAISISGAAVDPNMSFYQSGSLTALLTIFNARLGYWIEKPKPIDWASRSPRFGNLILTEFFGRTNEHGDFVHISDGGHFENLGVYELIRRRCRYIVALDAGEDGDPSDDNLATLIRLCRVDFGVRIKVDTRHLAMEGPDRLTRSHVAIGSIHYEDVDRGEMPGVLVYVKISLTGDEAPDLQKYARKDPRFPHQPTDLRQSFDEEQFECYRCLGDHIAWDIFGDPADELREYYREDDRKQSLPAERQPHDEYVPRLFAAVQERWTEGPEGLDELYADSNRRWSEIHRDLVTIPELEALSEDLYPEVAAAEAGGDGRPRRAELHTVARMLAIMENAWIGLSMKRTSSLPINRGWMNSFRRWVGSEAFRRTWPILRTEYSAEFVRFCEDQLHLVASRPAPVRLAGPYDGPDEPDARRRGIDLLGEEFAREWPDEDRRERGLKDLIRKAVVRDGRPLAWLIAQAPSGPEDAGQSPEPLICGAILAVDSAAPDATRTAEGDGPEPVELFVWVRRPYRWAGLGLRCISRVLPEVLEALRDDRGRIPALWTRYPEADPGDDDLEYMNFLRFFARFNFRPVEAGESGCSMLLRPGASRRDQARQASPSSHEE